MFIKNKIFLNYNDLNFINNRFKNKIKYLFSDKIGIVNAILERNEYKKYDLYCFQSLSTQTKVLFDLDREVSSGGLSLALNRQDALIGAISEAIERYCMSYVPEDRLMLLRYKDIKKNLRPNRLELHTESQYKKYKKLLSNPYKDKISWVKIKSLINPKKEILWPASLIYLPFPQEKPVSENTSTGVASHFSLDRAIKNALMEVIERDALMINFLRKLNPPEVDLKSIKDIYLRNFIKKLEKSKLNLKVYKLYTELNIPIFLGYLWKRYKNKIHFGIGACADISSRNALLKTLKECLFTYIYSKNLLNLKPKNKFLINALYEHFLYYQDNKFFTLLWNSKKILWENKQIKLTNLLSNMKNLGLEPFYINLTTKDVAKSGFKVVKVIVPGMLDLNKNYFLIRKAVKRLYELPKKLKLKPGIKGINPEPHPFP